MELTFVQFKEVIINKELNLKIYSYKEKGLEIALEPCLNGFDVALYDDRQELIYPKKCTNIKQVTSILGSVKSINKALKIAHKLYTQYKEDK